MKKKLLELGQLEPDAKLTKTALYDKVQRYYAANGGSGEREELFAVVGIFAATGDKLVLHGVTQAVGVRLKSKGEGSFVIEEPLVFERFNVTPTDGPSLEVKGVYHVAAALEEQRLLLPPEKIGQVACFSMLLIPCFSSTFILYEGVNNLAGRVHFECCRL